MGGTQSKEAQAQTPAPTKPITDTNTSTREEEWTRPLANKPLPKELQSLIDKEESNVWEDIYEGQAPESTDTSLRYAAYANRLRTVLLSAHRYVAYTSEIGEAFRPQAHPYLVSGAYAISWAYLIGDVSYEGYKAYLRQQQILHPERLANETAMNSNAITTAVQQGDVGGLTRKIKNEVGTVAQASQDVVSLPAGSGRVPAIDDYRAVMAQRAVFQSIASMGLPAFTVHTVVKYSGRALKDVKNVRIRTWGPVGLGLASVPFLPLFFDKPVEEGVEWAFHTAFRAIGGEEAVGHTHKTGREQTLEDQNKARKVQQKEL